MYRISDYLDVGHSWLKQATCRINEHKENLRRIFFYAFIVAGLLLILSFIFRNAIFSWYLDKKMNSFNIRNHAELSVYKARIRGLSGIEIERLLLRPVDGDTLLSIDKVSASANFWKLLLGRVSVTDFELDNAFLNFVRHDSLTNYLFLLERGPSKHDSLQDETSVNYAGRADRLLDAVFDKIPNHLLINKFNISITTNGHLLTLFLQTLDISDRQFSAPIIINEDSLKSTWLLSGELNKGGREAKFKMTTNDETGVVIPFIKHKWNADVRFNSAWFTVVGESGPGGTTIIKGQAYVNDLEVRHKRISTEKVFLKQSGMEYRFNIGKDYFELDSNTNVKLNLLNIHPYIRYKPFPSKQITLKVKKENFAAQELFSSLPPGLFDNLQNIRAKGNLSFYLDFFVDLAVPDSLKFFCDLVPDKFSVLSYGDGNFYKLNESFEYTAYEKGQAVRSFIVGPENPDFRRLNEISPHLQVSVLNSEDGAFWSHTGFMPEAFRQSIITNIKTKRFTRGGSTISMQLVKNVFLNRNKTIVRKVEEALIVWMIERLRLSTKERMFEVYLNIIEWGPMVYGANEAARFYFDKDVSKLTLSEAIFMASIIPRPKGFIYSFEPNGDFREYLKNYYAKISEKMLRKDQISQADFDQLLPFVELKGPARLLLKTADSLETDPLIMHEKDPVSFEL